MTSIYDTQIKRMPVDDELLPDLGLVMWAAIRLHHGVRDAIYLHGFRPEIDPFDLTLGRAIALLEKAASENGNQAQVDWVKNYGLDAAKQRNKVAHAVSYTTSDGKQALKPHSENLRLDNTQLRDIASKLIEALCELPK